MSGTALLLVVSGAILHALWNLMAKQAGGGLHFVWLGGLVSLAAALPFGLGLGALPVIGPLAWLAIAASAVVHVVYALVLQRGYRASDFSLVYPLARGSGPLFSVAGAILLLGERPGWLGGCGLAAVLAGIVLISGAAQAACAETPRQRAGLRWGLLTGATIAIYTLIDGWAVTTLGIAPALYYGLSLGMRSLLLAPQALADRPRLRDEWRRNRRYILGVGLLSPLAYVLVLHAMTQAPLAYVAPVRELSMLLGLLLGARVLREALSPARLVGTGLLVLGVAMLAQA